MPITPFSTPIMTEYKPLGLEAFAQPLSQMQQQFDVTKQAVEDTEFEINRLDKDDPKSKELVKTLIEKRDELASNLLQTKNYRQAAQKLKSLNNLANKDPELAAIKSNYTNFKKADEEQKKRIDGKTFTQRDYDEWKFKALNEFQGTNYNANEDTYSSINTHARMTNMEDAMRKESLDLAKMAATQGIESIAGVVQLDPFTKQQITKSLEYRDLDQVAGEIRRFLSTSDKYNDWVKEKADYEWYYNRHNKAQDGKEFNERIIQGSYANLNQKIELLDAQAKSSSDNPDRKKQIEAQKQNLIEDKQNLEKEYQRAVATNNFDDLSRKLYIDNAMGKFTAVATGAADIVDFSKQNIATKELTDDLAKDRAKEDIKELNTQKTLSTNIVSQGATTITSGVGTSAIDDQKQANYNLNTLEQIKKVNSNDVPILQNLTRTVGDKQSITNFDLNKEATKDIYVINNRLNNYQNQFASYDAEIAKLQREKNQGTPEERKAVEDKIKTLVQDKAELNSAYNGEKVPLEKLIENKVLNNPEAKKAWEESGKDVNKFLKTLEDNNLNYLNKDSSYSINVEAAKQEAINQWHLENPDRALSPEQEEVIKNSVLSSLNISANKNNLNKFSEDLTKSYRGHLSANLTVAAPEVFLDETAGAVSNGATDRLLKYALNSQGGAAKINRVEFNTLTGKTKDLVGKDNFDINAYDPIPRYAGTDQNGQPILRYTLKREYQDASSAKSLVAQSIRSVNPGKYTEDATVLQSDINKWKNENPTDLYFSAPGVSINPGKEAEERYARLGTTAIQVNDPVGYMKNIQNFATMHLIGDAERREDYLEMGGRLQKALQENQLHGTHKATTIYQAPAAWKSNEDGSSTGYQLVYTIEEGQIIATVNQVTARAGQDPEYSFVSRKTMDSEGNLPIQLVMMDLTFGTGREKDLIEKPVDWSGRNAPYVPALETSPQFFLQQ